MIATNIMSCKDEKEEKDDKMEQKFRGKTLRIEKKKGRESQHTLITSCLISFGKPETTTLVATSREADWSSFCGGIAAGGLLAAGAVGLATFLFKPFLGLLTTALERT